MNNIHAEECIFCNQNRNPIVFENKLAYALYDTFPVTPYHMLIIPRRHVETFFELTTDELGDIYSLLKICKDKICESEQVADGFNIGVNVGAAAGQSIFHVHVHLIPRRHGDIENPLGGVRGVIPHKRSY